MCLAPILKCVELSELVVIPWALRDLHRNFRCGSLDIALRPTAGAFVILLISPRRSGARCVFDPARRGAAELPAVIRIEDIGPTVTSERRFDRIRLPA